MVDISYYVFKYHFNDDIYVETIHIHFNYDLIVDKSLAMRHSECMQSLLSNQRFRLARHSSIQSFKIKRGSNNVNNLEPQPFKVKIGLQLFPYKCDISNDVNN